MDRQAGNATIAGIGTGALEGIAAVLNDDVLPADLKVEVVTGLVEMFLRQIEEVKEGLK